MVKLLRTDSSNQDFIELVKMLDSYLAEKDGDEHPFYDQFNKIDNIRHVVIAYYYTRPVACGAIKRYEEGTVEVKRMFTLPSSRGKGVAAKVLDELERWATELSCNKCILETGKKQTEAIKFYKKCGYELIENYGQYAGVENSLCFEKVVHKKY